MTTETFDTIVIGAGVAGAAFAAQIAHPSRRVLLVERSAWPRTKVCGCCLNSAAVQSLQHLGVSETLAGSAARIDHVRLIARARSAQLKTTGGLAASRLVLDDLLVQRATRGGVEFRPNVAATITAPHPSGGWTIQLRSAAGDQSIHAALVVAADGLSGSSLSVLPAFQPTVSPRAWFGVGATLIGRAAETCEPPPGEIAMHIATRGYAGLVRLDAHTVNLAAAIDPAWTRRLGGPAQAITAIIREAGGTTIDLSDAHLRGTALLTRRRTRVSAPGLLVIGDAAGYIEPFTGEGMAWALAGAEASARMVNTGLNGQALADAWTNWHTSHLRSRQRTCTLVRELLRRPRLVVCALAAINTIPAVARAAAALARRIERPYDAVRASGAAA